jgi:enoyl-CoA hydratase/carnithine racemase
MSDTPEPALVRTADRGGVRTLTLHRPEALNALTPALLEELGAALATAADDDAVRVVVLTGTGRAFSAGVDLKALAAAPPSGGDVAAVLNDPARRVTELLSTMPKVTIAKVNGFCFTGALELALACDLVVVAEEAKLGDTHAKFGLRPTWGMSARLIHAVGPVRARELSYTARTLTGADALAYGIASHCVPLADLDAAVDELADAIAANSPESIAAYKDLYRHQQDLGLADGLAFEYAARYPMPASSDRLDAFADRSGR